MLEQEVRGAVQGDRGLAGAGAALHDQRLVDRRTDDDVLLGLDRGDDLAHRTRPGGADLGQHRIRDAGGDVGRVGVVEMLVEVGGHLALGEREPPAEHDAERIDRGGAVERRRDRCPPVDDDRVVLVVLDVAAADVPPLDRAAVGRRFVDAAEELAGAGGTQRVERLPDRHLDVLGGDLVGGGVGVDPLEALDHLGPGTSARAPTARARPPGRETDRRCPPAT